MNYEFNIGSTVQYTIYQKRSRVWNVETMAERRSFVELRYVYQIFYEMKLYNTYTISEVDNRYYLYNIPTGQKWHNRRKLLTNTFHFKTLDMYNHSINKHSRILVDKLLDGSSNSDKEISIADYMTLCSLDIICGD